MVAQALAVIALGAFLVILMAPTVIALQRWYFGGGKLLRDRLGAPPSIHRPDRAVERRASHLRGKEASSDRPLL